MKIVKLAIFLLILTAGLGLAKSSLANSYSTNFPLTENPISEDGNWIGGQSAGNNLWGNVRTNGSMCYGVSEPTVYGDPTAILTGNWGADQTGQATFKTNGNVPADCCHEAEVRLRTTINPTAHTITGYEIYCSVSYSSPYCHIASWGGPSGAWANIEDSSPSIYLRNNDVLKATVTGTNPVVVTGYLNGQQIMSVHDYGNFTFTDSQKHGPWISGNPGVGFYDNVDNNWSTFGLTDFTASDGGGSDTTPPAAPSGLAVQ